MRHTLLLVVVFIATPSFAQTVTIHVYNYSTADRLLATASAKDVLATAGITATFIDCGQRNTCTEKLTPYSTIALRISDSYVPNRTVGGHASAGAMIATVYPLTVAKWGGDRNIAVAYLIAHEIGHAMGFFHTRDGVMKQNFTERDLRRTLTFTEGK